MKIIRWSECSRTEQEQLLRRSEIDIAAVADAAEAIVKDVRARGDEAIYEYALKFDGVDLRGRRLEVGDDEIREAMERTPLSLRQAIDVSVENVRRVHREQASVGLELREVRRGVYSGERTTPIESAGLYVPHGRGRFPSSMYMLGVPAALAGVLRRTAVTPPGPEGEIDPAVLYAAQKSGVGAVYRIGGAYAVAALAYGTESVEGVAKILGPGSAWVTAAKRVVAADVDVGLSAGPSESIVLADGSSGARIAAVDLLVEAEHGSDSSAFLVTPSEDLAREASAIADELIADLPPLRAGFVRDVLSGYGGAVVTRNMEEAIEFVNRFACEHVEILCEDPFAVMERITNAGEILLGPSSPFSVANYSAGTNHVIPTGARAHTTSPVSVRDFVKQTSVVYLTPSGLSRVGPPAAEIADHEGFPAHSRAIRERL